MAENDIELGYSPDAMAERRAQLLALLRQTSPEVISENQIDIEKLKELIGQDHIAPAEHYELSWAGKAAARREIQKTTSHALLPAASNPPQAPHMLIEGENLEVLRALGADRLILTNAAGSLKVGMPPGSIMLLSDHINFSGLNPLIGEATDARFVPMTDASPRWV